MTIRLRYYLAILPLFAGLGLFNGLLVYYLDRVELRWGLEQRAEGAAVSLAGFWETLEDLPPAQQQARLRAFSDRLGGLGIAWLDRADGAWGPRVLLESENVAMPPLPDAAVDARLREQRPAWRLIESPGREPDLNIGYAHVLDSEGAVRGLVAVAQSDNTLRDATAELLQRLAYLMGLLMLGGVLVAEWLTRYAKRELGNLGEAARHLASGQYLSHWPMGRIRELNDLGGTLLTMTSLLADGSHQTRRRFFEAELLPGDSELAGSLRTFTVPQHLPEELVGRCEWRLVGPPVLDEFFGFERSPEGWWIITGQCRRPEPAGSEVQRSLHAAAARDFLLRQAQRRPDAAGWSEALALFPCLSLQLLLLPHDGSRVQGWSLDAQTGLPEPWQPMRRFALLGTLPREALRVARAYERQFPKRDLQQVIVELSGLLTAHYRGILVVCEAGLAADTPEAKS